jgi:hypothetical protein
MHTLNLLENTNFIETSTYKLDSPSLLTPAKPAEGGKPIYDDVGGGGNDYFSGRGDG